MSLDIATQLDGSASHFSSTQVSKAFTTINSFESEINAQAPLGFFNPLGMLSDADQKQVDRLRYVELKNGSIVQLALLGQITNCNGIHLSVDID